MSVLEYVVSIYAFLLSTSMALRVYTNIYIYALLAVALFDVSFYYTDALYSYRAESHKVAFKIY